VVHPHLAPEEVRQFTCQHQAEEEAAIVVVGEETIEAAAGTGLQEAAEMAAEDGSVETVDTIEEAITIGDDGMLQEEAMVDEILAVVVVGDAGRKSLAVDAKLLPRLIENVARQLLYL
jgi:hypothetical protein